MPRAARPLAAFPPFLRGFGYRIATEQVIAFLAAVRLLGPRDMEHLRQAAFATLAPLPEKHAEFDALFRAFFCDDFTPQPVPADRGEETVARERGQQPPDDIFPEAINEGGKAASSAESLGMRRFRARGDEEVLARFGRRLPTRLPRRRAFRWARATKGGAIDIRRSMRAAVRNDGEIVAPARRRRRSKQRAILLLIDVSGSMKAHTQDYLRLAHALTRAAERVETFTFGTRLTRITGALRLKDRGRALAECAATVVDWDGGTRIGQALQAFLAVPRLAAHARGAVTVVLSDGLERGEHGQMVEAVRRLARLSWRLAWLTPLAADPRFRPETAALRAILPHLDALASGGSIASIVDYILRPDRKDDGWSPARFAEA